MATWRRKRCLRIDVDALWSELARLADDENGCAPSIRPSDP